jgi:hypothetical protein
MAEEAALGPKVRIDKASLDGSGQTAFQENCLQRVVDIPVV